MRQQEPNINWTISIDKANLILSVLGRQPFDQIADLIVDLRGQAASQLQPPPMMPRQQPMMQADPPAQRLVPRPNGEDLDAR